MRTDGADLLDENFKLSFIIRQVWEYHIRNAASKLSCSSIWKRALFFSVAAPSFYIAFLFMSVSLWAYFSIFRSSYVYKDYFTNKNKF